MPGVVQLDEAFDGSGCPGVLRAEFSLGELVAFGVAGLGIFEFVESELCVADFVEVWDEVPGGGAD